MGDNVSNDSYLSAVVCLVAGGTSKEDPLKGIRADARDAGVGAYEPGG